MKKFQIAVLLSVIAVTVFYVSRFLLPAAPPIDLTPAKALGEAVAAQAVKLTGGKGRIIVLESASNSAPAATLEQATRASFLKLLKQHPGLQIIHRETIVIDENNPLATAAGFAEETFRRLLAVGGGADALVSFAGPPNLTAEAIRQLPARRPKLIVVAPFAMLPPELFERAVIQVAIVPRIPAAATPQHPRTNQEWFDKLYRVITPTSAMTVE